MAESRKTALPTAKINADKDSESRPTQLMAAQLTAEGDALDDMASLPAEEFDPGWLFYTAFISLCIITLAVALDATSLSVALPVNFPYLTALPPVMSLYPHATSINMDSRSLVVGKQTKLLTNARL